MQTFNRLVRHNLERLGDKKFDYLVTSCATCTSTIKKIWPMMVQDGDIREKVNQLAEKTMDINQFLISEIGLDRGISEKEGKISVTYHDPCHLKKSLGVSAEPRDLIRANPEYQLAEMSEPDRCCGLGGSFNIQYYDLSTEIGQRKREDIVSTGCSVVATGCPACMIQLSDMLSKAGDSIAVKHPLEIYAEQLGQKKPSS